MSWRVHYHPEVSEDLDSLGPADVSRVMRVIDQRIYRGDPDKLGKPLRGDLVGCRRLRIGSFRIVYRVDPRRKEILVLAVGPRRREEVYKKAGIRQRQ